MKTVLALVLVAFSGLANATIHNIADVKCDAVKKAVKANGWAEAYVNDADVYHPTTFVSGNSYCDKPRRAYRVPVVAADKTCWLNVCAYSAFKADEWARNPNYFSLEFQ
jgi:hypothetical protein